LPKESEVSVVLAAAILLVVLGFWPRPLLRLIDSSCLDQAEHVNPPGALEIVRAPRANPATQLARR
jgi:NADH:ubiquinone oxidoreductase subunit 4 (subunit M)